MLRRRFTEETKSKSAPVARMIDNTVVDIPAAVARMSRLVEDGLWINQPVVAVLPIMVPR